MNFDESTINAVHQQTGFDQLYIEKVLRLLAQINAIKGFSKVQLNLDFEEAYQKYLEHPDRAHPHTVAEQRSYHTSYKEFVNFALEAFHNINGIADITYREAKAFSDHLHSL